MVNFDVSFHEGQLIDVIARRAIKLFNSSRKRGKLQVRMDVTAVHANGCPLDLGGLSTAGDFEFAHDILGIQRHLDRDTGGLGGCFLPRFRLREVVTADEE